MNLSRKISTVPGVTALFLSTFLFWPAAEQVFGWGQNGHRITAEIAERNLTPAARAALDAIVEEGETLAELSTWADDIRSDGSWDFVQPWHYISIDDDESFDIFERSEEGDILIILNTLEGFLRDGEANELPLEGGPKKRRGDSPLPIRQKKTVDRRQALALYVHFLGDLHQPLHVGRRDDQGGNRIQIEWFGEENSLHRLWDELLIESVQLSYTEFTAFLNRGDKAEIATLQKGSYLDWAKESKTARKLVYDFGAQRSSYFLNVKTPPSLGYEYRSRTMPLVRQRLKQGGFRLAAKLNSIFAAEAKAK